MTHWTAADVPDQTGRVAVVTGANSGLGFETTRVLAARGATVVLACRRHDAAADAADRIRSHTPAAKLDIVNLDLNSLESVRYAAGNINDAYDRIDLIVNNAGVMWTPKGHTADGFDKQLGINHLGHFAFTGLLYPRIRDVDGARIVTVSSLLHRGANLDFSQINFDNRYGRFRAYGQSKLANLLFCYGLQRRIDLAGDAVASLAAHPGTSDTDLTRHLPFRGISKTLGRLVFQDAALGALPTLRAATDPTATGGQYFGPDGPGQAHGYPVPVTSNARSHDRADQDRLWTRSEELTGVDFGFRTPES